MAKVLRCKHIGPDAHCEFAARAETEQGILEQVAKHAREAHGIQQVPPELVEKARAAMREE